MIIMIYKGGPSSFFSAGAPFGFGASIQKPIMAVNKLVQKVDKGTFLNLSIASITHENATQERDMIAIIINL